MAGSIDIDGAAGSRIDFGDIAAVPDNATFTVELWFNGDSFAADDLQLGGHGDSDANTGWFIRSDITTGIIRLRKNDAAGGDSGLDPTAGTWYYICFVHDSTANTLQAYYATEGDSAVTVGTATASFTDPSASTGAVTIGAPNPNTSRSGFNGKIAFFRVWNTALTEANTNAYFKNHITGDGSGAGLSGLVFNWDSSFEGTGVTASDFINQVTTTAAGAVSGTLARDAATPTLGTYGAGSVRRYTLTTTGVG